MSNADTRWINEAASRHGVGGNVNVLAMMKVAIDHERERCAKIAERHCPMFEVGSGSHIALAKAIAKDIRES